MLLEEILKDKDIIYFDSSIIHLPENFISNLHNRKMYGCLDKSRIEKAIESMNNAFTILDETKVKTTLGVVNEIENINKHLIRAIKDFNRLDRIFDKSEEKNTEPRKLFSELCFTTSKVLRKAKYSKIEYRDDAFEILSYISSLVANQADIKNNPKNNYGVPNFSDTDENIIAHTLYESMMNKKKSAILSRDFDLKRILYNTSRALRSEYVSQDTALIEEHDLYPVTFYALIDDNYIDVITTSRLSEPYMFHLRNLSDDGSKRVMDKLRELYIKFHNLNPNQSQSNSLQLV